MICSSSFLLTFNLQELFHSIHRGIDLKVIMFLAISTEKRRHHYHDDHRNRGRLRDDPEDLSSRAQDVGIKRDPGFIGQQIKLALFIFAKAEQKTI